MPKVTRWLLALIVTGLLHAAPAVAQDHKADVALVRSSLILKGVDLSGPCGAFEITKRVAWMLRGEGYGLLGGKSPAQNGCAANGDKYAIDWLLKADGTGVDILGDAGGQNAPTWNPDEASPAFFRLAFDPGDVAPPPVVPPAPPAPVPTPVPVPVPVPDTTVVPLLQQIIMLQQRQLDVILTIAATTTNTNDHVVNMDRTLSQTLGSFSKFVGKYIAPAVGGFLIARQAK